MASINQSNVPVYDIDLSNFANPYDICKFFKNHNITQSYLYRIMYKGIVLKFGMSEGNQPSPGDRLYRQVGHSQSWNNPINGPCGADWLIIERDMRKRYDIDMHKDDITVKVWDLRNYPFKMMNRRYEIEKLEAELIQDYVDVTGEKPIGNIYDITTPMNRPMISTQTFNDLFDNDDKDDDNG